MIKNLKAGKIPVPEQDRKDGGPEVIDLKKLGVALPVVVPAVGRVHDSPQNMQWEYKIPAPDGEDDAAADGPAAKAKELGAPRFDFIVQFCWFDEPPEEEPPATGEEGPPASSEGPPTAAPPAAVASGAASQDAAEAAPATADAAPSAEEPKAGDETPAAAESTPAPTAPAEGAPGDTPAAPTPPANPATP